MRVYHPTNRDHTLLVMPAADPRGIAAGIAADWLGEDGEPILFMIDFKGGIAEVSDSVGRYLIETKQAKATALIVPGLML